MLYVTTDDELQSFIERNAQSKVLAIDTEFLRERTYHPQLCLLQLGTEDEVALVDPFEVKDLKPLSQLLLDENMVKIVHSGRQDIEILYNELGCMPKPLFDTQVAASLLGYTKQIGYGPLVHAVCDVTLDKLDSFTDWSRRPLSKSQLSYAANDVIYLPQMYRHMKAQLEEKNRLSWLEPEFTALVDPAQYEPQPYERFRKLKKGSQLSRRQLSAAREVAAWREERAVSINIPRKWVLTDEQIVEACKRETRTIDQLFMVRGIREKLGTSDARTVVSLIIKGLDAPKDTWPHIAPKVRSERNVDCEVDLMTALVRQRAREHDVAFQTLVSHDSLQLLARGHYDECDLMQGWKYELIGKELVDLLEGRITLSIERGHMRIKRRRTRKPPQETAGHQESADDAATNEGEPQQDSPAEQA